MSESSRSLFDRLVSRVQAALPTGQPVYLVGGSVRDLLIGQPARDLDFVLAGEALSVSRKVANELGGAYYPLDAEREAGRVILVDIGGERCVLDFTTVRGPDLESDLRARDFTINAMALDLNDLETLIDPLGGASDLKARILRPCSPSAIQDDPLRSVRGIRLATKFKLNLLPETNRQIRQAAQLLPCVSAERLRDELFHILEGPQTAIAIRLLDTMGLLSYILPELADLHAVTQSPPHILNVWEHTLDGLQKLDGVLGVLAMEYDPDSANSWALGLLSVRLGRYRQQIHSHMCSQLNPERSLRALLFLAGLYHDSGKPAVRQDDSSGRVRFLEHEIFSAKIASERARQLHLSNDEIERLSAIVRYHMRPLALAQSGVAPSPRAIYRYFRDAGLAGVEIVLFSLADTLATYGPTLPQSVWIAQLEVARALLEAWWDHNQESVAPPLLVSGYDLMDALSLQPGPEVGRLLGLIREAQVAGQVRDREQALALAHDEVQPGLAK